MRPSGLPNVEDHVNATVIVIDAQKVFDSVNYRCIEDLLTPIGLPNVLPTVWLLYNDPKNDIIINIEVGSGYGISNGVKQGDTLSCSLFILAMGPMVCNIQNNSEIRYL